MINNNEDLLCTAMLSIEQLRMVGLGNREHRAGRGSDEKRVLSTDGCTVLYNMNMCFDFCFLRC